MSLVDDLEVPVAGISARLHKGNEDLVLFISGVGKRHTRDMRIVTVDLAN